MGTRPLGMTNAHIVRDLRYFFSVRCLYGIFALVILIAPLALYISLDQLKLHEALQPRKTDNPDHPSVAFLGDSHTLIPNWDILLNCSNTANYGIGGDTSAQIFERLEGVMARHPRLIVIMTGTNDALRDIPPETTIINIEKIKRKLRADCISHIVLAPPPLPARAEAIEIISDAATMQVPFVASDLLADGIHLRRSGYAKWRDAMSPLLERFCN